MSENLTPAVRFNDFTDDWVQQQVSNILVERNQKSPTSDEYPLMAFIANEGVSPKGERYDRSALINDAENKLYKRTELGDFIYSSNNLETGSIGLNKYGKACISPVYSIFQFSSVADSDFFEKRFLRRDFIGTMVKWRQGVVYGQWKIHESDFLKIKVLIPTIDEQQKIGRLLSTLDKLIALRQRKLELLQSLKKAMLQQMFPDKGKDTPQLRFNGFNDAWEQRKFEEIVARLSSVCSDSNLPRVEYEDIVSSTGQLNKDIYEKENIKVGIAFHKGDVLYGKLRPYLQNWLLPTFDGIAVGDFWVLQPQNTDSSFIYQLIQGKQFDEIANQSTGTKMPRADWRLVSKAVFSIPSDIREQVIIGTFFTHLDNLITLHQRELECFERLKKFLLQKMFV